ncbi:hypothetical protein HDU88_009014 [Geranomyces variabilis]|nr:hypothetical protein HDU88_009014 [Geranomyces variabilis]
MAQYEPITLGAIAVSCVCVVATAAVLIQQCVIVHQLRRRKGGKPVPRLQLLILGCAIFNLLDSSVLVQMTVNAGDLKVQCGVIFEPALQVRDRMWDIQDNLAAFSMALPAVYAATSSDSDKAMLDGDATAMQAIGAGLIAQSQALASPVWLQIYNYVQATIYADGLEWLVHPRLPQPTPELMSKYTTPAQLNTGTLGCVASVALLQADVTKLLPDSSKFVQLGLMFGTGVTLFTWIRVGAALLYGLSVLDRFHLFALVLSLPRWLIPMLRLGLVVSCAFSAVLLTGIWWANWDYDYAAATNLAQFYVIILDVIVSSMMVHTLVKLRRDMEGSHKMSANVRVTVPYRQLYAMFVCLVTALLISIVLAGMDGVVGAYLRMEMTAFREAILLFGYVVGFRFLSTLRALRDDKNTSALKLATRLADGIGGSSTRLNPLLKHKPKAATSSFDNPTSACRTATGIVSTSDGNSPDRPSINSGEGV